MYLQMEPRTVSLSVSISSKSTSMPNRSSIAAKSWMRPIESMIPRFMRSNSLVMSLSVTLFSLNDLGKVGNDKLPYLVRLDDAHFPASSIF